MQNLQNVNCEQTLMLISRHLDGDLSKEETWQLHHHTSHCSDCQTQMEEMAAIELDLSAYNGSYNSYSVTPQFNAKLMASIAESQRQENALPLWQQIQTKLKFLNPVIRTPFFPVSVGVMASFLIFFLLNPFLSPQDTRFTVAEIPFNQTQAQGQWQEHTIPPGQIAVISVNEDDQQSSLFRISSAQPFKIKLRYNGKDQIISSQQMLEAILKDPKITDGVMILNEGNSPLKLNAQSHSPQSIQVSLKHNPSR